MSSLGLKSDRTVDSTNTVSKTVDNDYTQKYSNTSSDVRTRSEVKSKASTILTRSSVNRRKRLELDIQKLEMLHKLEREHEEKELERLRRKEEMELERQRLKDEKELERLRRKEEMELERQRLKDEKELTRRKQLIDMEASLKSLSIRGSQDSDSEVSYKSSVTKNKSIVSYKSDDKSKSKVEKWLNENEPTVQQSSSAVMTTAAKMLADSVKKALEPPLTSCRQQLPIFSGRPDEWPMFFSAFESTMRSYSDEDNIARLRKCLEGEAFKMVKPLFVSSKNLKTIMKTLQMRFGRPEFIIESMMNQTKMLTPVNENNVVGLIEFSTTILNFTSVAESLHMEDYMTNPQLLRELLGKLPYSLKYNWAQHVSNECLDRPTINDFSSWLERQCTIMSIYFHPNEELSARKKNEMKLVFTSSSKEAPSKEASCLFCPEKHDSDKCRVFRKADISGRWKMVVERKLCFFCFNRHQLKLCKLKKVCGINGCKLYHHRLLHNEKLEKLPPQQLADSSKQNDEVISNHVEGQLSNRVLLRVCPVTLYGPKSHIDTYALLDDGSTVSLLDSSLVDELGIEGEIVPLTTCWSNNTKYYEPGSRKVDLKIKGFYEEEVFTLSGVRTQTTLNLPHQEIDSVKIRKNWPHLNSINQPLPVANVRPTILIGQDNCNLILTRKIIEGPTNAPVLSWCSLGWTLHGKCMQFRNRVDDNFTLFCHEKTSLHDLVKESFEIERYGEAQPDETRLSKDDERAVSILETTTRKVEGHYEVGLLWKSDNFEFPSSYDNALKRLITLEKKMDRDLHFQKAYHNQMDEYVQKGYARKLNEDEASILSEHTFYLPHFGVTNPNKPEKIRMVFDAAAKSHGVSFNDAMLSGPDYLNPLPSVLLKFRLRKYAIVGDIKEMFHQVRIREEDVHAQRFLWRKDKGKQPDTYVMQAMTFGSTCSPSTALFVVNQNAKSFISTYQEASNSILTKEYMDDLLDSTDTEEEAKRRVNEIIEIHRAGGFEICNWMSNSKQVLSDIPDNLKSNQAKYLMSETKLPAERVLGLWWNAESDSFVFHRNAEKLVFFETDYPTKREVLKAAMSIFDPLGLIAPTTIKGRLLVQEIWRTNLSWDTVLPSELSVKWINWLDEVKSLQTVTVQRCYFNMNIGQCVELHIFVDASEEAYAAAAYLRQESNNAYESSLVMSRAKVAPLKPLTIPRLELQAAILGCRLATTIQNDLGVSFEKRIFWSDSSTVLYWIKSDPKNYKQFVSNRIGEIHDCSTVEEWKWVPSKQNPADYATRSAKGFNSDIQDKWFHGPTFLTLDRKDWPEQPPTLQAKDDPETKPKFTGFHLDGKVQVFDINRYSSWDKSIRIVAWMMRYLNNLHLRSKSTSNTTLKLKNSTDYEHIVELQPEEIKKAEEYLLVLSQEEYFGDEIHLLSRNKPLPKASRIYLLSPLLDAKNIMRLSSRTYNSPELNEDQKRPILLDGRSYTSKLITRKYHEECFHQGLETVMCKVRERFWITSLRPLVKKVKKECMQCRINNAKPIPPQMAPLPECRVTRVSHPFFYTGVDYFGPIEVTVGRRHEKRWGVLFTCLSTRAVHLEVAHSLNTESCIMAIQRFISRRPCPSEMFSDNGTNFVASDKELRNAAKTLNHTHIQKTVSRQGIKWNYIPPRAPHMGGCWERLIRSVKTALKFAMHSQYPKDEELRTFLVRVEYVLNSRPLTHVSIDNIDDGPLTPNHFLMETFKVPIDEDKLCKRQLSRVRSLLDNFWKRWVREYLPCLTRRCKWHKKSEAPKVDDLAIIVDDENPKNTWPLGRITAVYPGRDKQIRVVDITTTKGTFRRPMTKVAVLSSA